MCNQESARVTDRLQEPCRDRYSIQASQLTIIGRKNTCHPGPRRLDFNKVSCSLGMKFCPSIINTY